MISSCTASWVPLNSACKAAECAVTKRIDTLACGSGQCNIIGIVNSPFAFFPRSKTQQAVEHTSKEVLPVNPTGQGGGHDCLGSTSSRPQVNGIDKYRHNCTVLVSRMLWIFIGGGHSITEFCSGISPITTWASGTSQLPHGPQERQWPSQTEQHQSSVEGK